MVLPLSRRPRVAAAGSGGGNNCSDGSNDGLVVITAAAATPASKDGVVLRLSEVAADNDEFIINVPLFVKPTSSDVLVDLVARVPDGMLGFVLELLRAAEEAGITLGGANAGSSETPRTPSTPPSATLFYEMARAFDGAALLVQLLDQGRGDLLAPNRALIKSCDALLALGLGTCFSSFASRIHSGAETAATANKADWEAHIFGDRAEGTTMLTLFLDPERLNSGAAAGHGAGPPAFMLVYSNGAKARVEHGLVLVSHHPGGKAWVVEPLVASQKTLLEVRFYVSRQLAGMLMVQGHAGAAAADRSACGQWVLPESSVCHLIDSLDARGHLSRQAAVEMFVGQ
jgi:hypothetical protein